MERTTFDVKAAVVVYLLQALEEPVEPDPPRMLMEDLYHTRKQGVEVHLGVLLS